MVFVDLLFFCRLQRVPRICDLSFTAFPQVTRLGLCWGPFLVGSGLTPVQPELPQGGRDLRIFPPTHTPILISDHDCSQIRLPGQDILLLKDDLVHQGPVQTPCTYCLATYPGIYPGLVNYPDTLKNLPAVLKPQLAAQSFLPTDWTCWFLKEREKIEL